jgi:hypothetical protein
MRVQDKRAALMARLEADEATQILMGHCLARPNLDRRASSRSDHSSLPRAYSGGLPSAGGTPRSPAAHLGGAFDAFQPPPEHGMAGMDIAGRRCEPLPAYPPLPFLWRHRVSSLCITECCKC